MSSQVLAIRKLGRLLRTQANGLPVHPSLSGAWYLPHHQDAFNFESPASELEIRDAALQFVRKLSGFQVPSKANEAEDLLYQ